MKFKLLLAFCISTVLSFSTRAQCNLQLLPEDTVFIPCGQTVAVLLSALGDSSNIPLANNFNDSTLGVGWQATSSAMLTNPCGPGPDGVYMWMGNLAANPRILTTEGFDLTLGGELCFDMRYAVNTGSGGGSCEGPDLSSEGVYLQYSTDTGATWTTLQYWDPLGGNDPILTTWHQYCFTLPTAAETPFTQIRWYQDAVTSEDFDHWGLDNVNISLNDSAYEYTWNHNGFQGANPPPVFFNTDTIIAIYYTNPATGDSCVDSVVGQLVAPELTIGSISDSTICLSSCIDLQGIGHIVFSNDTQITFENITIDDYAHIADQFVSHSSTIVVNGVSNLFLPTAELMAVCIDDMSFSGSGGVDISNLELSLVCPSLDTIILVPDETTHGTFYGNICFVPGGTDITQASVPYTGNFESYEPLSDLSGCGVNGIWQLIITNNDTSEHANGVLRGWSLTFYDPQVQGQVTVDWSPASSLSLTDSLNPTACPTQTTTYTLTISDSLGCSTLTHDVTIDLVSIDSLLIDATVVDATCDNDNGEIMVDISGTPGNEYLSWSNNAGNISQIDSLSPGTYTLTVSYSCEKDTTFTIEDYGLFGLNADVTNTTCEFPNGAVQLQITGGYGDFTYDWSDGQTGVLADSLYEGTYDLTVSDSICSRDTSFTLTNDGPGVSIAAFDTTNPFVNQADGIIELLAEAGTPPYSYSIDGGQTFQSSNLFTHLDKGVYEIVIKDDFGCTDTLTIELEKVGEIIISNVFNPSSSIEKNATFKILGMRNPEVTIFNRWGKKIYENSSYENDWDGESYKEGLYFYISKDNFDGEIYKGFVQLIRSN